VSVGWKGSGDVRGCGEGLVRVLVGIVRPGPRERVSRESGICGC
jgi:hypothetical protein